MPGNGSRPPFGRSLSARLLLLTVFFLLLGEVLIFVPSIARFRVVYLEDRIAAAHLSTIGLGYENQRPAPAIEDALLTHAGVLSVTIIRDEPVLMLGMAAPATATIDLAEAGWPRLVADAALTLAHRGQRVIRVIGPSPMELGTTVEVTLTELPLYAAMTDYAWRILVLSLVLSLLVAAMLFIALRRLIVSPLGTITEALAHFRRHPEDQSRAGAAVRRSDEIGIVDRELAAMTSELRRSLAQKTRLAALGETVSKLNHDLRNSLATALLVSDRLEASADPAVRAVTPKLVRALERAIRLCQDALDFAKSRPPQPRLADIDLRQLTDEVLTALQPPAVIRVENRVTPGSRVRGDPDQLHRLFFNLAKNAVEAMPEGGRLAFASGSDGGTVSVDIADSGPGLPDAVQARLFQPFARTGESPGTGLGLAISREIARAHGGELALLATGANGTTFRLSLPAPADRAVARAADGSIMRSNVFVPASLLIGSLLLAACTMEGPAVAGIPGLQWQLQRFYLDKATEANGMCTSPAIRSITEATVVEESEAEMVLRVRYFWRDEQMRQDRELLPLTGAISCQGFAERDFDLARMDDGTVQVTAMTGEKRNVRQNFGTTP